MGFFIGDIASIAVGKRTSFTVTAWWYCWQVLLDCCFDGHSLAAALCGPAADMDETDFDIRQIFRVVMEDDIEGSSNIGTAAVAAGKGHVQHKSTSSNRAHALVSGTMDMTAQCLWQVLDGFTPQQKRAFVKFVTGSDR